MVVAGRGVMVPVADQTTPFINAGNLEMTEYFVSYCPPDEQHCHCRCPVGELTDEQVKTFKRQSDMDYMSDYALHSADDLALGEIENKRAHLAALDRYNQGIMAVALTVTRLRGDGWTPPPPVSRNILRTLAQHVPPEDAQIFSSNEHVEFMLQCQRIAERLRDPQADFYTDKRSIAEYSVRYYRETQDVAKTSTTPIEDAIVDPPPQIQALTGKGIPEFITVEQAYIEDSDRTPANVRDNDAIEAIRALIALISKPLPVFYVDPSKDATGVIAPILQELRGIKEAVKEGAASRENDVFGGTYRAMARFRDPPDEIELEKIARLINDGWKWKDAVMEVYPDTKPEELDREVNRLQHVWKRDRKKPKNKLI